MLCIAERLQAPQTAGRLADALRTSSQPQTLATVQEMLETLCYEIVADAVFAPDNKQNRLTAEAETKIERRLTEIVRRMGEDKDCCLDYIDNYMKKYLEDYK